MSNQRRIVDDGWAVCNSEQDEWRDSPLSSSDLKRRIRSEVESIFAFLDHKDTERSFDQVEKCLISRVFVLGRLFLAYFLARRHEHSRREVKETKRKGFHERLPQPRLLGTFFGKVRYWRTYLRKAMGGGGIYPLDKVLGLTADGFSFVVMGLSARLATLVSYDTAAALFMNFLSWSPSKMSIEKAVLGLGRYTAEWFEKAPPPAGDGDVLVIQVDTKATPTATDSELEKRRGKRPPNPYPHSARHRGREKRRRRGSKPRRKKGDKSKNGKAATLVTMYTLKGIVDKDGKRILLGPLNKKVYPSYAPKRHAFAVARREADKRGFQQGSGKVIQLVVDGDEDLATYAGEFFPEAILTLDVMHVMEHLWEAGTCLFHEGSPELVSWVKRMEAQIYRGKALKVVGEITEELEKIPKKGPGNKGRRERLASIRDYLFNRIDEMDYDWLRTQDLEVASGSVEGGVKHVIGKRFDSGGMRWIRERAEALLQLRCIELNGDWETFMAFVEGKVRKAARENHQVLRIMTWEPAPLPTLGLSA